MNIQESGQHKFDGLFAFLNLKRLNIGLLIFLDGMRQIKISDDIKDYHKPLGNSMIVMGIISLIIGLFIIFRPYELIKFMTIIFGLIMLFTGVFQIVIAYRMKE